MQRAAKIRKLIAAAMLVLAGASVSLAQKGTTMAVQLTGGEWQVESIGGAGVDSRAGIAIAADGALSGSGGCNRLMGRAEINGAADNICAGRDDADGLCAGHHQQERKLLDALQATRVIASTGPRSRCATHRVPSWCGWRGAVSAALPVSRQTMTQVFFGR